MSDYIKREDAESGVGYVGIDKDYFVSVKEVLNITAETGALETQDRVRDLLPADVVEVRHGKWIKAADDGERSFYAECDQCHKVTPNGWNINFCPNCGARMDGEKE